jgi:hypothetical protein
LVKTGSACIGDGTTSRRAVTGQDG